MVHPSLYPDARVSESGIDGDCPADSAQFQNSGTPIGRIHPHPEYLLYYIKYLVMKTSLPTGPCPEISLTLLLLSTVHQKADSGYHMVSAGVAVSGKRVWVG